VQAFAFFPKNRERQLQVPEVRDCCVSRLNMIKGRVFYCDCEYEKGSQHCLAVRWDFDEVMLNKGFVILFCPKCGKEQGTARMIDDRGKLYDED